MNQTHNTQDDARLVMRVLNGEREAFTPLLLRYAPSAAHLCTTLLGKSHEAQDIAQDAAIQAFLGLSRLREPARFGAWFHAIAANLARSALRRRRDLSLHQLTEDATAELLWQKVPPGVEAIHEMREVHDQIMSALNELSAINRQTVIGFYLQGYSYLELAQLLGTSVGTVKGRLFQGRRQLQLALRPLADTVMQPDSRRKKDSTMSTSEPIKLHVDSLRSMLLTRQQFVILRTESGQGLPIFLTSAEAEELLAALNSQHTSGHLPVHRSPSQRILETLGAQVQRILVHQLAEQTFYATLTLIQGTQHHEMDLPLPDALVLALRMNVPLYATPDLLQKRTPDALPTSEKQASSSQQQAHKAERDSTMNQKGINKQALLPQHWGKPESFFERLWTFLLEDLPGTQDAATISNLHTIDLLAHFAPQEMYWQEQPMVALRLHHPPETQELAGLLIQPHHWDKFMRHMQQLPSSSSLQVATSKSTINRLPDALPAQVQQQIEAYLKALLAELELRSVLLLNPHNVLNAWQGQDSQETLQDFSRKASKILTAHVSLTNESELRKALGNQPFKIAQFAVKKRELLQPFSTTIGGFVMQHIHHHWTLIVILDRKPLHGRNHTVQQRIALAAKDLERLLARAEEQSIYDTNIHHQ